MKKKTRSQTTTRSEKIHSVRFHTYSYRFPYLQTHKRNVFEWKVNVVVQQHHTHRHMSTETLEQQIQLLVLTAIGLRFIQTVHKQTLFAFYGFPLQVSDIIFFLCSVRVYSSSYKAKKGNVRLFHSIEYAKAIWFFIQMQIMSKTY